MGLKPDGSPDRRHVKRKGEKSATDAVRELEKQRDAGRVRKPGRAPTVEERIVTYLDTIAVQKIAEDVDGDPCLVEGSVAGPDGRPVPGATVDVWQADTHGFYDVQQPDVGPDSNLRGLFTADGDGRFWFRTVVPRHYPIPMDGTVGELLRATSRHPNRPAHIHFEVSAPGMRTVTTHLFVDGTPYLDSDAVFGVKESLVRGFPTVDDPGRAAEVGLPNPFRTVTFDVVLARHDEYRDRGVVR